MTALLDRVQWLLANQRFALAEQELRKLLSFTPEHPLPYALLALCRHEQGDAQESLEQAQTAVQLAPENSFCHYVLAVAAYGNHQITRAQQAIDTALSIDPNGPEYFAFRGNLALAEGQWQSALQDADAGLLLEAEHTQCLNVRSMALLKLGRSAESQLTLENALKVAPEDATLHTQKGWSQLEHGDYPAALITFQEALRLDPNFEPARSGMIEALKSRYSIYRVFLRYVFWMGHFPRHQQGLLLITGLLTAHLLLALTVQHSFVTLLIPLLLGLYFAFNLMSWIAEPLFNTLLCLHPQGQWMLSEREKSATHWFMVLGISTVTHIIAMGIGWLWGHTPLLLTSAWFTAVSISLLIPVAGIFSPESVQARQFLTLYTVLLATLAGLTGLIIFFQGAASALYLILTYGLAWMAFSWVGNWAIHWKRP